MSKYHLPHYPQRHSYSALPIRRCARAYIQALFPLAISFKSSRRLVGNRIRFSRLHRHIGQLSLGSIPSNTSARWAPCLESFSPAFSSEICKNKSAKPGRIFASGSNELFVQQGRRLRSLSVTKGSQLDFLHCCPRVIFGNTIGIDLARNCGRNPFWGQTDWSDGAREDWSCEAKEHWPARIDCSIQRRVASIRGD